MEKESSTYANEIVSPGRSQKMSKNNWKKFPIEVEYNHRGDAPLRRNNTGLNGGGRKFRRFANDKNRDRSANSNNFKEINEKENKSENNTDEETNIRDYW